MQAALNASDTALDVYTSGLRNQHAVENQAIELLERQVGRLETYPDLRARLARHVEESREQARRLDELLGSLDSSASGLKDTVLSVMGNMAAMMHAPAKDEVIKNSLANAAFEAYEIASYKSLITIADRIGHSSGTQLLMQSLKEEQDMALWVDEHLGQITLAYMERAERGEKAGI